MGKIIEFLKDKIYFVMGITVFVIVLIIILASCSSGGGAGSYEGIEKNMISAAKKYYSNRQDRLPKEEGNTVKVTISTLVESELLKNVVDPKDKANICTGYVEVTKVGESYSYIPFLTCAGNYEAKYLKDIVINSGTDELGNGIRNINGEYVYSGNEVNNYVSFNDMLWRIIKVDSTGDIKLVLAHKTEGLYDWDSRYNSEEMGNFGITTDYFYTNMRKYLRGYYEETFTDDSKAKIVAKDICVGKYGEADEFNNEKDCSVRQEKEKLGLLNIIDFKNASLDQNCKYLNNYECTNFNYLCDENIDTWLLNSDAATTYKVYYLQGIINTSDAYNYLSINPVIYVTSKSIVSFGKGTLEEPYIIK